MPYIGKSPELGVRTRYYYTVSAGATSVSGNDDNSKSLIFSDGEYVDVSLNGVALVAGTDYNTTTANTIAGLSAMSANDVVEVIVYDVFSVFSGDISGDLAVGGSLDVKGGAVFNEDSADVNFRIESNGNENMLFVDGGNDTVNIGSADQGAVRLGQNLNMVVTGDTFGGIALTTYSTTDSRRSLLDFNKSGQATIGSHGVVADDEILGSIIFRGDDGDEFVDGAEIRATVDGTPGGNDMPTRLTFNTTADGANSVTERMRIESDGSMQLQNASGNAVIGLLSGSGDMYLGGGTNSPSDMFLQTGGNTALSIDANGAVTKPLQPAFLVKPASQQNNIATGGVTVVWGTEIFDQGGDFASNTFTAPVTGKYQLSVVLRLDNIDAASDYYRIDIQTSNRQYYFLFEADLGTSAGQDITRYPAAMSILADMDANDTAIVSILQNNGTAQTDIITDSYFSGFLAC